MNRIMKSAHWCDMRQIEITKSLSAGSLNIIFVTRQTCKVVQPFGISGPHWKKKSCLGPCIKYIVTHNHKKIHNVLSKFMILCWASFIAILGYTCGLWALNRPLGWLFLPIGGFSQMDSMRVASGEARPVSKPLLFWSWEMMRDWIEAMMDEKVWLQLMLL